jgi:hypothetical protein
MQSENFTSRIRSCLYPNSVAHETIAVDCGLNGGIARQVGDNILCEIMPTVTIAGKKELNIDKIFPLFLKAKEIVLEEQFILSKQGNKGNFTIGRNYGILLALAIVAVGRENVYTIHPRVWQGGYYFPRNKSKKNHIELAQRMGLKSNHDGIADAFLLLKYHNKIQSIKRRKRNV